MASPRDCEADTGTSTVEASTRGGRDVVSARMRMSFHPTLYEPMPI